MEHRFRRIGIVGLGLIGGSMAKTASRVGYTVYAADRDADVLAKATADGVVTGTLDAEGMRDCDLVLLALYPTASVEWLWQAGKNLPAGCVVVDLCGVKRAVSGLREAAQTYGLCYVGGHPMAGAEKVGYASATDTLFDRASMILTPDPDTDQAVSARLEAFFLSLGFGSIRWSNPEEHDRMIAYTSQLSHVLSSAYIKSPTAQMQAGFSAGSFRDMTRVAWLNEQMWTELFLENADYLADEVDGLADRLHAYAAAIRDGDAELLRSMLLEGKRIKEQIEEASR